MLNMLKEEECLDADPVSSQFENGNFEVETLENAQAGFLFEVFASLLIGVITWIPVIIYFIFWSPGFFIAYTADWYSILWLEGVPGGLIISAILGLLTTIIVVDKIILRIGKWITKAS